MAARGDATKNTTMALHVLIVVIRVKSCKITNLHLSTHTCCDSAGTFIRLQHPLVRLVLSTFFYQHLIVYHNPSVELWREVCQIITEVIAFSVLFPEGRSATAKMQVRKCNS